MPGGVASRLGAVRNGMVADPRPIMMVKPEPNERRQNSPSPIVTQASSLRPSGSSVSASGTSSSASAAQSSSSTGQVSAITSATTPTTTLDTAANIVTGTRNITDVLFPSSSSTDTSNASSSGGRSSRAIPQTVLMWIFAVIALGVITIIVVWR
ncbi:hypothetical protein M422DRAFT_271797 [Sphaerobolus stellatus SS14]|uniref:Uncharacterized protein n=1 Tax=Sphaerobolus stellatus (strain SS14) TaxID=990650 RepID=A0A0C9TCX8_SPHS4|nr:hypothetical protein M422DRAFT_271797 [Sphaerobolus stellatus SS14]